MKAEETITIDLRGKSAFSDYMIVTTGRANRHVGAIAENVTKTLKENGIKNIHVEGLPNCDWVLIDSGMGSCTGLNPRGGNSTNLKGWGRKTRRRQRSEPPGDSNPLKRMEAAL